MRKSVENWSRIKKIIAFLVMALAFSFFTYMGVLTVINGSKDLSDLNYVKGKITDVRFFKHKRQKKFKTIFEDVLVLRVDGTSEEFGFTESTDAYKALLDVRKIGKTAEIYFDSSGKRIEQSVTLHTFDLKIGDFQAVYIKDIKKSERIGSIFFFSGSLIMVIMAFIAIREDKRKKRVTQIRHAFD